MPKIVDRELYRKELLSKCFDLFAEKGYGSITMRQIAQGLEVSTGTLYHYFPSKQALFEQLVEIISQNDIDRALEEVEGMQTLQEKAEAIGEYLIKNEDYFIKWTYILVNFYQHQDAKKFQKSGVFMRVNERYQQAIYKLLGIEDRTLAVFIYSFIDGLILEKLWVNEMVSISDQCELLGKMLTAYVEKYK
ncbi:MAG: TetR/AcrR family transcriptional regulator [Xenococcaceae cyanobacterium]